MHLIINSIYSNVEVFLRELISNGSDALDKIRIIALTNRSVLGDEELGIKIRVDEAKKELHISDSGVGMTQKELVTNLGTIAKSGTKEFAKAAAEGDAQSLIGQFGVGFYSAFLVADRVTVISKSYLKDEPQYVWHSDAAQNFVVAQDPRGTTMPHGTHIILHFKDSQVDLLKEDKLKDLIGKYSEFISFPIRLWTSKNETEDVPLTEEELEAQKIEADKKEAEKKEEEELKKMDDDESEEKKDEKKDEEKKEDEKKEELPKTKSVTKLVEEWTLVNAKQPIWTRPASDITKEEYHDFYKHISKDWQEPSAYEHFKAEGDVNFRAIVYIPQKPSQDYWQGANENAGLKLYVKRVYITDNWKNILPRYLGFIRGVVDAEDVDLNVSREVLQQSKTLNAIKSKIVRKTIGMIQQLAQNETEWAPFWKNYAKVLKYGILEDNANKERLSKLLRFESTTGNQTTLQEYVDRFIPGQEEIYYLAGESMEHVKTSPLLEKLQDRGLEVLFLVDPIDEYVFTQLTKFDGKHKLTNVAREGLTLPGEKEKKDEEDKESKQVEEEWKDLTEWLKTQLKDKVRKVVVSKRLTKSMSALVAGSYGMTANMERIVKSQALGDQDPSLQYQPKPVLEINVDHPVLKSLRAIVASGNDKDAFAIDTAELLFESSAVSSGYGISDPQGFAARLTRVLSLSLQSGGGAAPEKSSEQGDAEATKEEL